MSTEHESALNAAQDQARKALALVVTLKEKHGKELCAVEGDRDAALELMEIANGERDAALAKLEEAAVKWGEDQDWSVRDPKEQGTP